MQRRDRHLLFFLLLLAATFSGGCRSEAEKIEAFIGRGDAYAADRMYAEAVLEYKNAIQLDPNQATAHWGLAKALIGDRRAKEGLWELQETVRLDPKNLEARLQLGRVWLVSGKVEEALAQATEALAQDPTSVAAELLRAQTLEAQKKFDEALAAYRAGLTRATGGELEPDALRLLVGFHTRRGDLASAAPYAEKLVEIDPSVDSFVALGEHSQREAKADKAEAAFRQAVERAKSPGEVTRAHAALASSLYAAGRSAEAIETLQKGIASTEDSLDLTYLLARFYTLEGAEELADRLVREAAEKDPTQARPFVVLSSYEQSRGRPTDALAAIERALAIDPDDVEARIWRVELLVELGQQERSPERTERAREEIEALLEKDPAHPGALVARAKIDVVEGRPEDALKALATASQARPDWAVPHHRAGSVYGLLGDWTRARTELALALELDDQLVDARRLLVRAHQMLGEHEYAIEAARRVLLDRPDDTETRTRLAQSLFSLGRAREASDALAPIPEKLRTPEVRYAMAQLALAGGRTEEARTQLTQALAARPNDPDVLQALLALDLREKKLDRSMERIRAAVEAEPGNARLHQLRAAAALASGDPAGAEAALRRAVELEPGASAASRQLADLQLRRGRIDDAIATYEAAIEHAPKDPKLPFLLAILYERTGRTDAAIRRYEQSIALDPKLAEAQNNLAFLLAESDRDLDRALELARQARALLPDDPTTADTLGWVYLKRDLPEPAIEHLLAAEAARKPGDPERGAVQHHLALAYAADGRHAKAVEVAREALRELESARTTARPKGGEALPEPAWADELRALVKRSGSAASASPNAENARAGSA
ncbi:MAG: tetratricopeptide repeat protein [Myxococcota bacterium]